MKEPSGKEDYAYQNRNIYICFIHQHYKGSNLSFATGLVHLSSLKGLFLDDISLIKEKC